jgi:acyl carrier protein
MPDRVQRIAAEVFQIPVDAASDLLAFGESKHWDSVNHINLMLALEEAYETSIADDDVVELTTLPAIRRYLAMRGLPAAPEAA